MTLRTRLLIAIIALVSSSIIVMGLISVNVAVNNSTDALTESARSKLINQEEQTREALGEYFGFIESQIRTKSYSLTIVDAAQEFIAAFDQYSAQRGQVSSGQIAQLESYYNNDFRSRYNDLNSKELTDAASLLNGLPDTSLALQYDFIGGSQYPLGEKDKLDSPSNNSDYARVHSKYHPTLRGFLQEFEYYDIFIADVQSGNIVYSVFKELDYATSLRSGPYANSGIGEVFSKALTATDPNQVFFTEFKQYRPSYDALAGFASSPIYANGEMVAVLIFQMPMDHLNGLLTHKQKWVEYGFGDSGETYIVGQNNLLVTESRFFLEDQAGYINAIRSRFPNEAREVESRGTTIGIQPVTSQSVKNALRGQKGFTTVEDYRGVEVFSAYAPIEVGGISLAVLAEIDVEEALRPAKELRNKLIISSLLEMVVLLTIAAVITYIMANRLIAPLKKLGEACEGLTTGEGDLTLRLSRSRIPEIHRITQSFNIFIGQIREIIAQVKTDADALSSASQQLSTVTTQSAHISDEQRTQTSMVATAMIELSSSIDDVARSTVDTSEKSLEAQRSLNENMERADMAAENIKLLVSLINDSSEVISSLKNEVNQITTVLNVITSIADQTNLLALNAAIEAARAGEAGRGFSVVADEVRALATRSQESTVEISKLVEVMNQSSQKSVERMERAAAAADGGIHLVDLVTVAMDELAATLKSVLALTDTVSTATVEQNATSDSVVDNVNRINSMAQEVSEGASQTSQSADELARIAEHTKELVARFKV
ncbi:methyl-accepting chemotaxis protein [Aliiglaciecola sp. M165]|uniref:methyl-accepting chemotaxis protein n=1 Tax=Aliiglaciecola sp. M165 TaxID=2593649 RepID=UPI00117DD84D|nr:methyl-accepting chemotaxis protein [Aliiglaciecola sp. M165]TRY31011.1 methyl-accepting chemotaxis protein [Aliiglaciecola sp. M165]